MSHPRCDACWRPPTLSSNRPAPRRWPVAGLGRTDVEPRDGRIWLRITGHGTDGERADWVAFGDDAAVSGGLVRGTPTEPEFCGDAIADPLTGLHAALAVAESLRRGGGELIEMSMAAVAARVCGAGRKTAGPMLIQRATLLDGTTTDIRLDDRISEVGNELAAHPRGELVFDADGATVIPGLHDHHVHLRSAAAALTSTRVGPAEVHSRADLAHALHHAEIRSDGWIRAVGYHEAVAGPLDRVVLDEVSPPVPVRVQHRSGVLVDAELGGP